MKKNTAIILSLFLILTLCACSSSQTPAAEAAKDSPAETASTAEVTQIAEVQSEPEAAESTEEAAQEAVQEDVSNELYETALNFIDKDVSQLIDAIGEPTGTDYMPSCMGDGDDGELYYDGFYVATYREGNEETVIDVILN